MKSNIIKITPDTSICDSLAKLKKHMHNELHIMPGVYHEKIKIKANNLKIVGIGNKENIVIEYDDYSKKLHEDGLEYNTFRTYTLMVIGKNIEIENVTIKNTSPVGKDYGQQVALHLIGDNITLNNVRLLSHQDTLFLGPLPKDLVKRYEGFLKDDERIIPLRRRIYINDSYIEGDIDFVFGSANAYFNNTEFHSLERPGYVFAPSTYKNNSGFIVNNSIFTGESKTPNAYLARPWRECARVKILNSKYENHIYDEGFSIWDGTNRHKTSTFYEKNSSYIDSHKPKRSDWLFNKRK